MTIALILTALLLGIRHAFDPDHIAAIDTSTRHLTEKRVRRPWLAGTAFSLGHSGVVIIAGILAVALGTFIAPAAAFAEAWGPVISTLFLLVMVSVSVRALLRERTGAPRLEPRGRVAGPWGMLPVGTLFSLGYDTATQVSLLVLTAAAVLTVPSLALILPLAFALGMVVTDTLQARIAQWAYSRPLGTSEALHRYRVTMICLSGSVALIVAAAQTATLLGFPTVPLNYLGIGLTVALVLGASIAALNLRAHGRAVAHV